MPSLAEKPIANPDTNPIEPSHELSGKTAMIVGASRGIGRGVALAFAGAGARVIAVSRSSTEFAEAGANTGEIREGMPWRQGGIYYFLGSHARAMRSVSKSASSL